MRCPPGAWGHPCPAALARHSSRPLHWLRCPPSEGAARWDPARPLLDPSSTP
ncbi:hypothetical protein T484DRAFT_1975622 [Baffinella frigidus]|nr:hypothetical protein T484DRAFT_1975622 [Cryptophyta sp. CCMP2293]